MLHLSTIAPSTLVLLKELMKIEEFNSLRLVGETSLALQIGHRKSIDLDLFGEIKFEKLSIEKIFSSFSIVKPLNRSKYINSFMIDNIKVDFVDYSYPRIDSLFEEKGIRMATVKDIAAMKLAAITNRGSRKDFVDIYFLLKTYSLHEMIQFFNEKYRDGSEYLALKSLIYFEDAENDFSVEMMEDVSWEEVKSTISKEVAKYLN